MVDSPLFLIDFPDPSVICVDGVYYMTTTSMYFMPGIPILRSVNLKDWSIVTFVYDTFDDGDAHNLRNGRNIYAQGSWATSLRFAYDHFYVCFNSNDQQKTYIYRTRDITSRNWDRVVLDGSHHDPSLLFDDDGHTYIVYGGGTIYIKELRQDAMGFLPSSREEVFLETPPVLGLNCEGSHLFHINDYYYLFLIQWPKTGSGRRIQWCYRSSELRGPYTGKVILDDDLGYYNQGVAQGGVFQGPDDQWYAMLFQDRFALGRCPVLYPLQWEEDWPVLGQAGGIDAVDVDLPPLISSDDFLWPKSSLPYHWQWNHNPDLSRVEVGNGRLRLQNGAPTTFMQSRNMLTQRTSGPRCSFTVRLEINQMLEGDCAGLAALQYCFGIVGVKIEDCVPLIYLLVGEGDTEVELFSAPLEQDYVYLRVEFDSATDLGRAHFAYSPDGVDYIAIGDGLNLSFSLKHFTGYRAALVSYGTKQAGGVAGFREFRYEG